MQALELLNKTARLDPLVYRPDYQFDLALTHLALGKRDQAIDEMKQILARQPTFSLARAWLAGLYDAEGKEREALAQTSSFLKLVGPINFVEMRKDDRQYDVCVGRADRERGFDRLERLVTVVSRGDWALLPH